jgi:hypothetical protein
LQVYTPQISRSKGKRINILLTSCAVHRAGKRNALSPLYALSPTTKMAKQ